jgi:hypothetical protein
VLPEHRKALAGLSASCSGTGVEPASEVPAPATFARPGPSILRIIRARLPADSTWIVRGPLAVRRFGNVGRHSKWAWRPDARNRTSLLLNPAAVPGLLPADHVQSSDQAELNLPFGPLRPTASSVTKESRRASTAGENGMGAFAHPQQYSPCRPQCRPSSMPTEIRRSARPTGATPICPAPRCSQVSLGKQDVATHISRARTVRRRRNCRRPLCLCRSTSLSDASDRRSLMPRCAAGRRTRPPLPPAQ